VGYSLAELEQIFREDLDDLVSPYLWSEQQVAQYFTEAQKLFAKRTDLLMDSSTASIVQLAVTANQPYVSLSPLVTKIRRAQLASQGTKLHITNFDDLDATTDIPDYGLQTMLDWTTATGTPRLLVADMDQSKARLVPIPTQDDTINISVFRMPLSPITYDNVAGALSGTLEVTDEEHQRVMLLHAKALAYQKQDADVQNMQLAGELQRAFYEGASRIKSELKRARRRAGTVRYGGL